MSTLFTSNATDGQRKQYGRMTEDAAMHGVRLALEKVEANSIGWQRVLEHGDELRTAIADVIVAKTRELSVSDQYADEEVESSYGYLSGYKPNPTLEDNLKDLEKELATLRYFSELAHSDYDRQYVERIKSGEVKLPKGAERWTLIPRWDKIASMYGEATQKVLDLIKQARNGKFHNYRESLLGPKYLRQHERSVRILEQVGESQSGDILIVAVQFGLRHRGKSVRRAREIFEANEFGLDAFSIGIMLLTHPERLAHFDDLWIDCAGDDFAPDADGRFSSAPYFDFSSGHVEFDTYWVDDALDYYGSASGFCP